jgi:hypothetical protein
MFTPTIANELTRTEVGYAGATALLALMLWTLYRQGSGSTALAAPQSSAPSASTIAR